MRPDLDWPRWRALQAMAKTILNETESPTLTDLPPLEYHQTKRVDHRLIAATALNRREATTDISQPRSGWFGIINDRPSRRDDGIPTSPKSLQDLFLRLPMVQPLRGWLMSGAPPERSLRGAAAAVFHFKTFHLTPPRAFHQSIRIR